MTPEQQQTVLAHTQYVARFYVALRQPLAKIVELISYSIGPDAPPAEDVARFLRLDSTQRELELHWETALWCSADINKSWRLICLAVPDNVQDAATLLARPVPPSSCAFCHQSEPGFTKLVLQPELDLTNTPVGSIYLHRQCQRPWRLLRDIVARAK